MAAVVRPFIYLDPNTSESFIKSTTKIDRRSSLHQGCSKQKQNICCNDHSNSGAPHFKVIKSSDHYGGVKLTDRQKTVALLVITTVTLIVTSIYCISISNRVISKLHNPPPTANPYEAYLLADEGRRVTEFEKWFDLYMNPHVVQRFVDHVEEEIEQGMNPGTKTKSFANVTYENGNYFGQINSQNLPDGFGQMNYTNGIFENDSFKGGFKNGTRCGPGKLISRSIRYVKRTVLGHFLYDRLIASGDSPAYHLFQNGDYYFGPVDSEMNQLGYGKYVFYNRTFYVGHFEYNMFSGIGCLVTKTRNGAESKFGIFSQNRLVYEIELGPADNGTAARAVATEATTLI